MNAIFSQDGRRGRLSTVLGQDTLVLLRMDGSEDLSGAFEWRVEALSNTLGLSLDDLLGTHASVEIDMMGEVRCFDGIVTEAAHAGAGENGFRYDLVLRPWLYLAGLQRNQRIFHRKSVVQILEELLAYYSDLGDPHLEIRLDADYPELEYTVQYGESDADFAIRQMERFGIAWHYTHAAGSHTLVLTDTIDAHDDLPGGSRAYHAVEGHHMAEEEHFYTWRGARSVTTGAVRLTEYNFKTPKAAQEVDRVGDAKHARGQIESFDWPGDYLDQGQGRTVVARRTDAERGLAPRHYATGDVVALGAGLCVTVVGEDVPGVTGQRFVCLRATHRYRSQAYGTGDAASDDKAYVGDFVLLPATAPLAPPRRMPPPRIAGPETAVVVGEGEIDCDEHGRILVRFHWDLAGAYSMRCRVSQNWASKGWGGMVIPRIGMEVIVEHLRGDPDKPIVTGCVYNGANTPPYPLPDHKTKSVFRTDTHHGTGFNELSFEDEQGIEKIYIHAQRDMTVKVENHATERVDRNKIVSVGGARINETLLSASENVGHNLTFNVGAGAAERVVTGQLASSVFGIAAAGYFVDDLASLSSGGGQFVVNASGSISMNTDQSMMIVVNQSAVTDVGANYMFNVGGDARTATAGSSSDTTGKVKTIEAHEKLHLRCGASEIIMEPDGTITILGTKLLVEEDSLVKISANTIEIN